MVSTRKQNRPDTDSVSGNSQISATPQTGRGQARVVTTPQDPRSEDRHDEGNVTNIMEQPEDSSFHRTRFVDYQESKSSDVDPILHALLSAIQDKPEVLQSLKRHLEASNGDHFDGRIGMDTRTPEQLPVAGRANTIRSTPSVGTKSRSHMPVSGPMSTGGTSIFPGEDDESEIRGPRVLTKYFSMDPYKEDRDQIDLGLGNFFQSFNYALEAAQYQADQTWSEKIKNQLLHQKMTGHAKTWLASQRDKLEGLTNIQVQDELFKYATLGLNPKTIMDRMQNLTKKKDETFLSYKERHINGTKCLQGGIQNPDSCLTGAKIFADHANDLVGSDLLCVQLDWRTKTPIKLFDQIVDLLQSATGSTGENYAKRANKKRKEEVHHVNHQAEEKSSQDNQSRRNPDYQNSNRGRYYNRGRGRGKWGRGRGNWYRRFCHICKRTDHTTAQHKSIIEGEKEITKDQNTQVNTSKSQESNQENAKKAETSAVVQVESKENDSDDAVYEAFCIVAEDIVKDLKMLMSTPEEAQVVEAQEPKSSYNVWGLDSMASLHMTNDLSMLTDIHSAPPVIVTVADGKTFTAKIAGTLQLRIPKFRVPRRYKKYASLTVKNVYFIPDIKRNLLSEGKLEEDGYILKKEGRTRQVLTKYGTFCGEFKYERNLLVGKFLQY